MRLQDAFALHHGERPPHLLDRRIKGPKYCYAVPRGPAVSVDGKHWELCDATGCRVDKQAE